MKSTMLHYLRCIGLDNRDQCFIKLPDGNNNGFILFYNMTCFQKCILTILSGKTTASVPFGAISHIYTLIK